MSRAVRIGLLTVAVMILVPVTITAVLLQFALINAGLGALSLRSAAANHSAAGFGTAAARLGTAAVVAGEVGRFWQPLISLGADQSPGSPSTAESMVALGTAARTAAPAVPTAMGGDGPRRYLICALNDAELFGSGGAPLYVSMLEMNQAQQSNPVSGTVGESLSPGSPPIRWDIVGGLPWYTKGAPYPFVNTDFHPQFPYSGQNIMRAWKALGYPEVQGVITIDVKALSKILAETGSVTSPGYGELTADNIARKVLVDSYRKYPEAVPGNNAKRRALNDALRKTLSTEFTSPDKLPGVLRGISASIPGRHVQLYMADPVLQESVRDLGADGTMDTPDGDILGVFLQAGVSKLSIFQQRAINQDVAVHSDGSASVVRKVTDTNAVPADVPGDPKSNYGYLALTFQQRVAYRIPDSATAAKVTGGALVPAGQTGPFPDQAGAKVLWQGQNLPPRHTAVTTVTYELPAGTFGSGAKRRYHLTANPQAFTSPVATEVHVRFDDAPAGSVSADGWTSNGDGYSWRGVLDRPIEISVGQGGD